MLEEGRRKKEKEKERIGREGRGGEGREEWGKENNYFNDESEFI